jgi:hypothetical protein
MKVHACKYDNRYSIIYRTEVDIQFVQHRRKNQSKGVPLHAIVALEGEEV